MLTNTPLNKSLWESANRFWFDEITPKQWFVSTAKLDQTLRDRFSDALHTMQATLKWDSNTKPSEAELTSLDLIEPMDVVGAILITDQFSRNIHRGNAKAFATDKIALSLSNHLIDTEQLNSLASEQVQFAVMPQMHAEDLTAQKTCVELFKKHGIERGLTSAVEHLAIIEQFGRFPHRNLVLGRGCTVGEIEFLKNGNSFGQKTAPEHWG